MPYNMIAWTVSRILVVTLFIPLTSCSDHGTNKRPIRAIQSPGQHVLLFQPDSSFTVSAFAKKVTSTQNERDSMDCVSWTMSTRQIKSLLEKGQSMNGSEWHHYYAHTPVWFFKTGTL